MRGFVTWEGKDRVLEIYPTTGKDRKIFTDFHKLTKPYIVEFIEKAGCQGPHIEIRKELL